MADFSGLIITERGQNLLALAQAGTGIHFSHVECGSGEWPEDQNPENLTGLVRSEKTLAIQDIKTPGDGSTTVSVFLTNSDLDAGFFFREIGLFASDPNNPGSEILYAVSYSGDRYDFIPARGGTLAEELINLMTIVGNASQVSATISGTVVIATKQNIDEHNQSQSAHPGLRVQTPVLVVLSSDEVDEGDTVTVGVRGYVPGLWDLEAKFVAVDDLGNRTPDPFGLAWNSATGTATGTAPEVGAGADGASYSIVAQLWEHGLMRSTSWSDPVVINVGDVPINAPTILSPTAGATDVGETPTIMTSEYDADDSSTHADTEIHIATDRAFVNKVFSGRIGAVTSYAIPSGNLPANDHCYMRAWHQGSSGRWSPVSAMVDFYTSASFVWVVQPIISAPLAGATDVGETPELIGSVFNTNGSGSHASTDWQVQAVGGDWSAPVYESLADTGNLESITVPAGILSVSTGYQARCRYRDDSGTPVESDWAEPVSFTTAASFLASTLWAAWDQLSESTLADPNVIVCMLENPVTGGNEQAQGGGLTAAELLMEQYGNVDGATADGRHFGGGYFRGCTGLADWLSGASVVAFAGVVRINDGELENSILTYTYPDLVWMINGTMLSNRTLQFYGFGHPYTIVSGACPQDTWIHCYADITLSGGQTSLRLGWDTAKRNRWQDVAHRITSTASWAYGLTTGASELFIAASPNQVGSYNLRGDIKYGVIARDFLLED